LFGESIFINFAKKTKKTLIQNNGKLTGKFSYFYVCCWNAIV